MSHAAVKWAWKQDVGEPIRKLILLFLADAANPDNQWHVWHSYRTIAAACGCSRGSVGNHMAWLIEYRFLVLLHQGKSPGDTNRYLFNWENEQIDRPTVVQGGTQQMDGQGGMTVQLLEGGCATDGRYRPTVVGDRPSVVYPPSNCCAQTSNRTGKEPVKEPVRDGLQEPAAPGPKIGLEGEPKSRAAWVAYAASYERRYGATPITNATVNSQLCRFVDRVGAQDAPQVAAHYLTNSKKFYVERRHPVGVMLEDAEALHNEWITGTRTSSTQAAQMDRSQSNLSVLEQVIAQRKAEGKL